MTELIQTINRSVLELVGDAVELVPAFLFALTILLATRYGVKLLRRILRLSTGQFVKRVSLQLLFEQIASVTLWIVGILCACTLIFPSLRLGDIIGLLSPGRLPSP